MSGEPQDRDGGNAFPLTETHPTMGSRVWPGMSLRDWFAGQAMQGELSSGSRQDFDDLADVSYRMADAMLKARNQ
jgi:hypothetical protein